MSAKSIAAVDATVKRIWDPYRPNWPALYVGIDDPKTGSVVRAYGLAAPGRAATTADSFRIGSISKTFTATVILQLVADGKLTLAQTIAQAAPAVAKRFPTVAQRTLKQLLSMTSGISDYVNSPKGIVPELVADPQRVFTSDELIRTGIGLGVMPAGTPGYTTTNFILLQEIAEEVTGKPLAKLIASTATSPLKLEHTYLPANSDTTLPAPVSDSRVSSVCQAGFASSGGTIALGTDLTSWNASYGQGGGGMTSTITDLRGWAASEMGNDLLPAGLATQRLQFAPIGGGEQYGLGITSAGDWVGHEGEALGWESIVFHDPKTGVSVAFASNSCGQSGLFPYTLAALYPGTLDLPTPPK
jgi:D-alanyl-D-alanine carboxypeptidase